MNNNYKIKTLVTAIAIISYCNSAHAAEMSNQQIQALVNQVVAQKTQGLQQKVGQLQSEVVNLKQQLKTSNQTTNTVASTTARTPALSVAAQPTGIPAQGYGYNTHLATTEHHRPINMPEESTLLNNEALTRIYLGAMPLFASPYIGLHSSYDGSDLIVSQSAVNLDARLLKQQEALIDELASKGFVEPNAPVIEVSGEVEPLAFVGSQHPGNTQSDITLNTAELDVLAKANPWVFGYMAFAWDDVLDSPFRVSNAVTTVDKAFITIGNLNKSPVYSSFGQLYVPFGQYNSYMIAGPLPELMARTKARAAVLGVYPQGQTGPLASVYVFKSDTSESDRSGVGGVNLGYNYDVSNLSGTLQIGGITNIADSLGMQENDAPDSIPFAGFGESDEAEEIFKAVPAVDFNGTATYGHWNLVGEYVDTTTSFDHRAMTFNNLGAHPSAGQVELAYTFTIHNKPGNIAVGYDWTQDALALLLPKQRYTAAVNYSFWRNTVETLELRRDANYSLNDTATGADSPIFNPLNEYVNIATIQMAVLF